MPGATFDVKWGADRGYSVGGKMFAVGGPVGDPTPDYGFKASDMAFELLVEQGLGKRSPYLVRAKWVKVAHDALPDAELCAYLAQAHALVAAKLPRKARLELGITHFD